MNKNTYSSLIVLTMACVMLSIANVQAVDGTEGNRGRGRPPIMFPIMGAGMLADKLLILFKTEVSALDIIGDAPLADTLDKFVDYPSGMKAWATASITEALNDSARHKGKIQIYIYNYEDWQYTPLEEKADIAKASEKVRNMCDSYGWLALYIPQFKHKLIGRDIARYYDIYVIQCQKFQIDGLQPADQSLAEVKEAFGVVKAANPACRFGIQISSVGQQGGVEGGFNFYKRTREFCELYSIWWPSQENNCAEKAMELLHKIKDYEEHVSAPAQPAGVKAIVQGKKVVLSWVKNTEKNLKGYCVLRSHANKPFSRINIDVITGTSYEDSTVENAVKYNYQIEAINDSSDFSRPSDIVAVEVK